MAKSISQQLSHSVSNMFNFDLDQDKIALKIAVDDAVEVRKRHDNKKLGIVTLVLCCIAAVAFVVGALIGGGQIGKEQNQASKESMSVNNQNLLGIVSMGSTGTASGSTESMYGGFCYTCSKNSAPRGWSWWFGWGPCKCHSGWKGACCDVKIEVVNGGFGPWKYDGECSDKCGSGTRKQVRLCNNPAPLNGGKPCLGAYSQLQVCNLGPCLNGQPLTSVQDVADAYAKVFSANIAFTVKDYFEKGICYIMQSTDKIQAAYYDSLGSQFMYEKVNFLRGFKWWELGAFGNWLAGERWLPPVPGEEIAVKPFAQVTKGGDYGMPFMHDFFTAANSPSWEEDAGHDQGIGLLTSMLSGADITCLTRELLPRFPIDHDMLMKAAWDGFTWFGYHELKYASNGDFGYHLALARAKEQGDTTDHLGLIMSETVFSAHLTYNSETKIFSLDLSDMEQFKPIPGFLKMGGKAEFVFDNTYGKYGRLRTTKIEFDGKTYTKTDFDDQSIIAAEKDSRWVGWRLAEKAIMASLCGQTNLILHVKGLHLEIAAAFQGVVISAFSSNVKHPLRRLLDQFTHRSVQATNGNFDLLFEQKAAEFSLAPITFQEQLRMLEWYINEKPLSMKTLSMPEFAAERHMSEFSKKPTLDSKGRPTQFFWRWHYRANKAQTMFVNMIDCWVDKNYGGDWNAMLTDNLTKGFWEKLKQFLPSINQSLETDPAWLDNGDLTRQSFTRVLSTIITWVSHIHEDVGHSASYVVYNPTITPMMVPEDGVGVPFNSFAFNTNAYRTFVFLERAKLLEEPAPHWFKEGSNADKVCYTDMQATYTGWGKTDDAFSDCGEKGFYSCVESVETSVSS